MAVASGHKVRLSVNLEKQKKKFSAVFLYMVVSKLYTNPQITFLCQLYIWNYNNRDWSSIPAIILRTRRSLRAVHFHPLGAPYLLTAEVEMGSALVLSLKCFMFAVQTYT